MRLCLILPCLGFTLRSRQVLASNDPKFRLRSNLKLTGGPLFSGVWRGESLYASDSNDGEGQIESTAEDSIFPAKATLAPRMKHVPLFKYTKKKGRVTLQLSNKAIERSNTDTDTDNVSPASTQKKSSQQSDSFSLSVDPFATFRLLGIIGLASREVVVAFVGTLKLLGPLIFARRVLAQGGELVSDYMMGRYLRTTYDRIERKYWKEYQGPAASRSMGRCCAHMVTLLLLGRFMEWMVGLGYAPCVIPPKAEGYMSCHWWCGLLWIVAVIGTGNLCAALFATKGPLKTKITKSALASQREKKRRRVFSRPLNYLSWMKNPDQWITDIATSRRDNAKSWKPFTPEPLLFPSTWPPFSILRNIAVAKAMASSSNIVVFDSMHLIMRQFLIQQAILDEWHRVLMDERRVGLGVCVIAIGFTASCFLFVSVAYVDGISAVLTIPSLLATFSSAWMNLFVFWDRRMDRASRQTLMVEKNRRRLGRASYSIKW